jgi:putative transposase
MTAASQPVGGAHAGCRAGPSSHRRARPARAETARNHRNGHSRKTVLSGSGKLEIVVPRDRQASFEPQLIAKYRRRFGDKAISLYVRGLSMREIEGHLRELYVKVRR